MRSYSARCSPDATLGNLSRSSTSAPKTVHAAATRRSGPALARLERRKSFGRAGFGSSASARRLRLRRALMQRKRPNDRVVHRRAARREPQLRCARCDESRCASLRAAIDRMRSAAAVRSAAGIRILTHSPAHSLLGAELPLRRHGAKHVVSERVGLVTVVALYLKTPPVRSGCANSHAVMLMRWYR